MLYLRALGGLALENGGRPLVGAAAQRGRLAILAMLATAGDRSVSRDRLLAVFWPDQDEENAHGALRQALYALRRDTGERELTVGTADLRLNPAVIDSDVLAFDLAIKSRNFDCALEAYAGPLLDGIHLRDVPEFEHWLEHERARRVDQYRTALEQLATAAGVRGDHHAAVDLWKRRAALDPLSATYSQSVMKAHVAAGDWPAALQHARSYDKLVRAELGAGPDPAVVALVNEIRTRIDHDPPSLDRRVLAERSQPAHGDGEASTGPGIAHASIAPRVRAPRPRARTRRVLASAGAVVVVLITATWAAGGFDGRAVSDISVAPHRVAVATFRNRSGDASLDPLGMMAADWIARGLAATGAVDVAGTSAELQSRAGVTIGNDAHAVEGLGREARAGLVISGAFYRQGDSLLFEADFTDIAHSKLLQSVGPTATPAGRPIDGIEKLRERVTGALAPFLDSTLAGIAQVTTRPPNYEAYREFLRGESLYYLDKDAAANAFLSTSTLDPGYVYPLLRAIGVLENAGRNREADSLLRLAGPRRASLTPYENAYLDFLRAAPSDDKTASLAAVQRMRASAPRSDFAKYLEANSLNAAGQSRAALAVLERLDPQGGALRGRLYYYVYLFSSLHALGYHHRTLEAMRRGRVQYQDRLLIIEYHAVALAVMGRSNEVVALLDSVANRATDLDVAPVDIATSALREAIAHDRRGGVDGIRAWLRRRLPRLDAARRPEKYADVLAALEDWPRLAFFADSVARRSPGNVVMLGFLGLAAAKLGERARALDADRSLTQLRQPPYGSAEPGIIRRATIAAALGEKDRAVRLLRTLSIGGWNQELWHSYPLFGMLRGYAPFEALLVPMG